MNYNPDLGLAHIDEIACASSEADNAPTELRQRGVSTLGETPVNVAWSEINCTRRCFQFQSN
jgi:hypothetical protein